MNPYAFDAVFWIAVVCCAVAQLFILRAALATPRPASEQAAPLPPVRRATEVLWVLVPAAALALVFAATWRAMHPTHLVPAAAQVTAGRAVPR